MKSTTDTAPDSPAPGSSGGRRSGGAALALGALGVVYGDIGTSPLYTMKQAFSDEQGLRPDPDSVYGVLSLVFWTLVVIVSVKYVILVLRADNRGEGGTMALVSLVQAVRLRSARAKWALLALGVLGTALFYADGAITPAITVLGAVEGLEVAAPGVARFIIPIAVVLLSALFVVQRFGTSLIGWAFGPVMLLWFTSLGGFGLLKVIEDPSILRALSPTYAVAFFVNQGGVAFLALGAVVLAVTGAEALYADIGHFGRGPIRRSWFALVLPTLMLNYLGQGVTLLTEPGAAENPFFRLLPVWALIPMVVLATMASVIASQAVISGVFSTTRQAVRLGYLPFLAIRHTSEKEIGQIYVPVVNWVLFVVVLGLVLGFGSSTALASAYGIAVTGTFVITTVLFFVVVRTLWRAPLWLALAGAAVLLVIELSFLAANLTKVTSGGWFPLVLAAVLFVVLMTWHRGRDIVTRNRTEQEGPLQEFVDALDAAADPPVRVPGTAVFLNANATTTPLALRHNIEHNHVLHEHVVIVNVETMGVPHVTGAERVEIDDLHIPHDGISLVTARFGYQDRPDVPGALRLAREHGLDLDPDRASYFLSRITITPTRAPGMVRWRKQLFTGISRNTASPAAFFDLPEDQVVSLGSSVDI